jgi:hypothetical protein
LGKLGVFLPKNKNTTFMDDDYVIIWPGSMLQAVAAMAYRANCIVGQRCPLSDYRGTRASCTCLAQAYFEDASKKYSSGKSLIPRVVNFASEDRGPPFTARYYAIQRANETAILKLCMRLPIVARAKRKECW